jgi:hypothetical protein
MLYIYDENDNNRQELKFSQFQIKKDSCHREPVRQKIKKKLFQFLKIRTILFQF